MREFIYNMYGRIAIALLVVALQLVAVEVSAQYYPERRMVREGNDLFSGRNYRSSLERYNSALEADSTNYAALYNRANAYYHTLASGMADSTMSYEISNAHFERIANDELLDERQRAEVLRNLGQSLFGQERYEAALNAFRQSLLLNPDDEECRYDYILTKRIVDQKRAAENQQQQQNDQQSEGNDQQQSDQQSEGNDQQQSDQQSEGDDQQQSDQQSEGNDPEGDNESNGEDDNESNGEDEQESEQDSEQGEDEHDEEDGEQPAPSEPQEITADQERMLDAIQAEEDRTQDRLREAREAIVRPGQKNW